jgi:hypothetical protein
MIGVALLWLAGIATTPAEESEPPRIREVGEVEILAPAAADTRRPVFPREELARRLRKHIGRECDPNAIAGSLARPYRFLGYVPTVEVSCSTGVLSVRIRESNQTIDRIAFDPEELAPLDIARESGFDEDRGVYPVRPDAPRGVLKGLLQTREGDLYNAERYRSESEALGRLGYAVAVIPGSPGPDGCPRAAYLIRSLAPPRDKDGAARPKSNYLGATATYEPRQRGSAGILYQKHSLFGPLDRLSVAPRYNAGVGADLSYRIPLLAAREAPHRLYDLELGLFSELRNNRLLEEVETDVRRSGGMVSLGARLLETRSPGALRLSVGFRHERTDLEREIPGAAEDDLTLLRAAAEYDWRHTYRWPSLVARVVPYAELAIDAAGGDRSFVRAGLDSGLHGRFPGGVELDLHLIGGTLDRGVPAYELWSLGGAGTLRGFREDSFLGRTLVALQSEIWLPVSRAGAEGGPAAGMRGDFFGEPGGTSRIGRHLKAAVFLDAGRVSQGLAGEVESAAGAGGGLRVLLPRQRLLIRFDYGWGFGAPDTGSHPYVSIGYHF